VQPKALRSWHAVAAPRIPTATRQRRRVRSSSTPRG
jgi:hypothetical protein